MALKRAKILSPEDYKKVNRFLEMFDKNPDRSKLILALSMKAGLRATEIASLRWFSVIGANGGISENIELFHDMTKYGTERTLTMHPDIRQLLEKVKPKNIDLEDTVIKFSIGTKDPADALVTWFRRLFKRVGLIGCSSHSGRRTFITGLARVSGKFNASLREVQVAAGHANIATTEGYIEVSDNLRGMILAL